MNEFILSDDSGFDGTIDFAAAIADSSDPEKMLKSMPMTIFIPILPVIN